MSTREHTVSQEPAAPAVSDSAAAATAAETAETTPAFDRALTAQDRCDSCGAPAYVRALAYGSELLFCAHHARKHTDTLKPIAEAWHDETHRLFPASASDENPSRH